MGLFSSIAGAVTGAAGPNLGGVISDKRKQSSANNGEIVVAMTEENEATVKRFYKEKDHYRLQPENDTMAPIILPKVTILGKVVSLYRNNID